MLTFLAYVVHIILGKEKIKINVKISVPLILFILWATITMEGNYYRLFLLGQLIVYSVMTIGLCYKNDRRLRYTLWAYISGSFIATCLAVSGYLKSNVYWARAAVRGQNENEFAIIAGMSIIILLFLKDSRWKMPGQAILYAVLVFFLYGLIISASRGAIVALCMLLPIYFILQKKRLKSIINIILIVLLGSSIFIIGIKKEFITEYTVEHIQAIESPEKTTLVGRFEIWRIGWKIAKDNFITGVGLGNFPSTYKKYTGSYGGVISGIQIDPHNTYLSILVETGFIGLALFLWFFAYLSFFVLKKKDDNRIFAICLLAFIGIVSIKGTNHFSKIYWFCIALSFLISYYRTQHFNSENDLQAKKRSRDLRSYPTLVDNSLE
jgi:O-antigen ligase